MLLELAHYFPLKLFSYVTFRAVMAALTSLLISFWLGPALIRWLAAKRLGQNVRDYVPNSQDKSGTPTMGGLLVLTATLVSTLLWSNLNQLFVWCVLAILVGYGLLGLWDDWEKIVRGNAAGISATTKLVVQVGLAAVVTWVLIKTHSPNHLNLVVPFFKSFAYPLGWIGFGLLSIVVIVGTSNAVNLTDGLDGLAIMPGVMVASGLAVFAYVSGHAVFANYLGFPSIPGAGEVAVLLSALAGAGLAFLWFNAHPAQVFMGDVGALSIGGVLGVSAVIVRQEIVLAVMGMVFVLEALSVMLQVFSFKTRGKRIFKMAPLHHHFELKGWTETQVVVRFWIITMMCVLAGLATLKIR